MILQYSALSQRTAQTFPRHLSRKFPVRAPSTARAHASLRPHDDHAPREVVLLSGGIESSTLLRHVHAQHRDVVGLFFRYGQRASEREEAAARAQCAQLGVGDFVLADLSSVGETLRARQRERRHVPLPHRNLVLLSVAVSVAAQEGGRVWVGICADDVGWYASASREFVAAFRRAADVLGVAVETPLLGEGKADVVRRGLRLGLRPDTTWSCMLGRAAECGRCVQCRARERALREAGVG